MRINLIYEEDTQDSVDKVWIYYRGDHVNKQRTNSCCDDKEPRMEDRVTDCVLPFLYKLYLIYLGHSGNLVVVIHEGNLTFLDLI